MSRPFVPQPAVVVDDRTFDLPLDATSSVDQLAVLSLDASAKAKEMARQIGYQGAMSVGALEDEIRFYQRRTVEAILETGKRLLVLRELLPKGNSQIGKNAEFEARVELLGFSKSTAYRFMQAATKTAKSLNLSVLSTQVKSASAFLELVTHDDDVLDSVAELDDIDRLSASQLRAKVRELAADKDADKKLLADKNTKIDDLQLIRQLPPDKTLALLKQEATTIATEAEAHVTGRLRDALAALSSYGERGQQSVFMAGLVGQVQRQLNELREKFSLPDAAGSGKAEWQQWADAQDAQSAAPGTTR